ncbi:hypothetical protein EJ03DRAFT_10275 [Teratosphaeria nubilosa]|uniref:Uncharacterized protein n=1 Tax=Teratosphaeria nubilosa TaxID=161662 RepID=A0A6G1LGW6_9PEZI|nr:hypothetical protein EJ03DRAFT_10275 [Teratosphaeria nubilosa]
MALGVTGSWRLVHRESQHGQNYTSPCHLISSLDHHRPHHRSHPAARSTSHNHISSHNDFDRQSLVDDAAPGLRDLGRRRQLWYGSSHTPTSLSSTEYHTADTLSNQVAPPSNPRSSCPCCKCHKSPPTTPAPKPPTSCTIRRSSFRRSTCSAPCPTSPSPWAPTSTATTRPWRRRDCRTLLPRLRAVLLPRRMRCLSWCP